jgi:two-component system sensor histidine kinase CiaH
MSGKLRKKFILITAVSIFIVMTLVVGAINIINRRNTVAGLDSMLQIIASGELTMKTSSSEDTLPQTPSGTAPQYGNGQDGDNQKNGGPGGLSPEAQYKTRYFTVTLADDGSVTRTFTDKIAAVTAEEAASLGQSVYASGGTSGFSGVYRYLVTEVNGSHVVIFLDSQSELEAVRSLTGTSCIVGIASYAAAMLMIVLLSRRAVRPLERNEEKQKRFITDASHELKTPLTVISANMDVLGMDVGENEWLTSTRQQITKMRQLISHKPDEQRMGPVGPALELRVVLHADIEGMFRRWAAPRFPPDGRRGGAADDKARSLKGIAVIIVELIAVAVALGDIRCP